ncbi:glycosyltransferase family 39 protein [Candidatus Shapirobacteria bacterium]|nr:glycosyltransferase family 39 protein [Candidatus Shapirobacteria bacterium]
MKKVLVSFVLLFGLLLRLYKVNEPIADWHSHRQTDTVAVTQIFANHGFDFLHPQYFDISSTQSGKENPQGYRMVEAPIYNSLSLWLSNLTGINVTLASRLISIILSLGSGLLIFLIVHRFTSQYLAALFSLALFMFLPFNVFYSRVTLPEPTAVFFMLLSLYLFSDHLLFSGVALAISLLVKPYTGIILFPTLLTIILTHKSKYFTHKHLLNLVIFSLIALIPFALWRGWISQFPEGIPSSNWLLNNGVTTTFPAWFHGYNLSFLNKLIAFRPHWWQWLFQERLSILILGNFGVIPIFLGLAYQKKFSQPIALSLVAGILLYFIFIAQGNIQHDYYQTLIIPSLAILGGIGYFYISQYIFSSIPLRVIVIGALFIFSSYFSLYKVKDYYRINNPTIITAGNDAQKLLPVDSLLIAPNNGDTTLLYHTGFFGWPTEIYDIDTKVKEFSPRPVFLLSLNYDKYTNALIAKYPVVVKNDSYIILKLSP